MITGNLVPSHGRIAIANQDVHTATLTAKSRAGYCPQFDRLYEQMTVEEHLYLYGRIRGLAGRSLERAVHVILHRVQLGEFQHREALALSGGTRRKLVVAIALICEPAFLFLDEPSAGMDPLARRFLWTVIQDAATRNAAVVLTTQSMEGTSANGMNSHYLKECKT